MNNVKYLIGVVEKHINEHPRCCECYIPALTGDVHEKIKVFLDSDSSLGKSAVYPPTNATIRIRMENDDYSQMYVDGIIEGKPHAQISAKVNQNFPHTNVEWCTNSGNYQVTDVDKGYREVYMRNSTSSEEIIINGDKKIHGYVSQHNVNVAGHLLADKITFDGVREISVDNHTIKLSNNKLEIELGRTSVTMNSIGTVAISAGANRIDMNPTGIILSGPTVTIAGNLAVSGSMSIPGFIVPDENSSPNAPMVIANTVSIPDCLELNALAEAYRIHQHLPTVQGKFGITGVAANMGGPVVGFLGSSGITTPPIVGVPLPQTDGLVATLDASIEQEENDIKEAEAMIAEERAVDREIAEIEAEEAELDKEEAELAAAEAELKSSISGISTTAANGVNKPSINADPKGGVSTTSTKGSQSAKTHNAQESDAGTNQRHQQQQLNNMSKLRLKIQKRRKELADKKIAINVQRIDNIHEMIDDDGRGYGFVGEIPNRKRRKGKLSREQTKRARRRTKRQQDGERTSRLQETFNKIAKFMSETVVGAIRAIVEKIRMFVKNVIEFIKRAIAFMRMLIREAIAAAKAIALRIRKRLLIIRLKAQRAIARRRVGVNDVRSQRAQQKIKAIESTTKKEDKKIEEINKETVADSERTSPPL